MESWRLQRPLRLRVRPRMRSDVDDKAVDRKLVDDLVRHVDCLAGLIGPRHLGKPAALEAAAAYVERELAGAGYAPVRQRYDIKGQEVANIAAELPGGRRIGEIVVVGGALRFARRDAGGGR